MIGLGLLSEYQRPVLANPNPTIKNPNPTWLLLGPHQRAKPCAIYLVSVGHIRALSSGHGPLLLGSGIGTSSWEFIVVEVENRVLTRDGADFVGGLTAKEKKGGEKSQVLSLSLSLTQTNTPSAR